MSHLDQPAQYVIKVNGRVDEGLADRFGPLRIDTDAGGAEDAVGVVTTLSGLAADQAALVGLIRHLHGLGIVLLSVQRITAHQTEEGEGAE